MSVRLCSCHQFAAYNAISAGAIVNDDLTSESFRKPGRNVAPDNIVTATGRKGNNKPHRF